MEYRRYPAGLAQTPLTSSLRTADTHTAGDWRRLLIGESDVMHSVCRMIGTLAPRRATVLITGETGSGKELAARALHMGGERSRGPFVAVNCGAVPEHLLEDELFGHVRGAYTGALQPRAGKFEQAHGGTLFLDEIGELPLELQPKLLRVVQEREFQRLGASETTRVDVRLVAATNADLTEMMRQGRFREDLYYRLSVVPVRMPPLRQRRGDIPALASHFVEKFCRQENLPLKSISAEALETLQSHSWPGNVRELENAVERAVALSGAAPVLEAADFSLPEVRLKTAPSPCMPSLLVPDDGLDYERTLASFERNILAQALQKTGGNKKAAADMLGLKRTTLSAKVRSLASAGLN